LNLKRREWMDKELSSVKDPAKWIEGVIRDFINRSPENTLKNQKNDRAWADPLVGFSGGDDPLFEKYREYVASFHMTPQEIFNKTFPETKARPGELTIISWILPQTEESKADNRKETHYPSERWARARIFGEEVNNKLRAHVVKALEGARVQAVAPILAPFWERKISEKYGRASNWSERHAAYASGLGTFGLCDGLITPRGKAMRCGSVIARIAIPPMERPYQDHRAYCLFFSRGTCKKCAERCPAGAITEAGHDKEKCYKYMHPRINEYVETHFGFKGYGCGLCQTAVPCESRNPVEKDRRGSFPGGPAGKGRLRKQVRRNRKGLAEWPTLRIPGVPTGIRTRVTGVKGRCPRPLDDGDPEFLSSYSSYYKKLSM
jgi:epoxyqueuosine reductase